MDMTKKAIKDNEAELISSAKVISNEETTPPAETAKVEEAKDVDESKESKPIETTPPVETAKVEEAKDVDESKESKPIETTPPVETAKVEEAKDVDPDTKIILEIREAVELAVAKMDKIKKKSYATNLAYAKLVSSISHFNTELKIRDYDNSGETK